MRRKPVILLFFLISTALIVSSCASAPEGAPEDVPEETREETLEQPAAQVPETSEAEVVAETAEAVEQEEDALRVEIDEIIRQLDSFDNVTVVFTAGGVDIAITRAFAPNSAFLDTRLAQQLNLVGRALTLISLDTLVIEGHVADVGNPSDNQPISEARAANTADYLTGNFTIPRGAVTTVGRGGTQPIAGNGTESGRARNRRVVLFIRGSY